MLNDLKKRGYMWLARYDGYAEAISVNLRLQCLGCKDTMFTMPQIFHNDHYQCGIDLTICKWFTPDSINPYKISSSLKFLLIDLN